jgi:amino acid adenylation domain-containing protein
VAMPQPHDPRPPGPGVRGVATGQREAPASYGQERLWFFDQLLPNSAVYNDHTALHLQGPLDVATLDRGLREIVRRHEALRTTFRAVDGRPVQVIHAQARPPLAVTDLRQVPPAGRRDAAVRLAAEQARRPFDLTAGPLLRPRLLRLSDDEHVLLLTFHHIVFDGWSMGVLGRELGALYEAYRAGRRSPLPELPMQYADYARWQRSWLQGPVVDRQLAYWRRKLAGAPALLELPADRPRPVVDTHRGDLRELVIPAALGERLGRLGREEGATPFMALLAGFKALLHRYTGWADILVGTPVAGRTRVELEELIGFFVNTVVLRTQVPGELSFRQLLGRVRDTILDADAHQDLPFERLVADLQPLRQPSHHPLFQVLFDMPTIPDGPLQLPGLRVTRLDAGGRGVSLFDLGLSIAEDPGGLRVTCEYSTELFERSTIDRMLGHYRTLLAAVADQPDRPIGELPMLGHAERQRILAEWNATAAAHPRACLHQLVEERAASTPRAVAAIDGATGRRLTYGELNRQANRLARHLRTLGVGPEVTVGLFLPRSLEVLVGLLGILKAGGAYLPLDLDYPPARVAFMLQDAAVPVVVTRRELADRLPAGGARRVLLDAGQATLERQAAGDLGVAVEPENPAYVMYTSGSTGQPKGVLVPHRSVVNYVLVERRAYGLTPGDRVLQFSPLSFDASVEEIFPCLAVGATLVLRTDAMAGSTAALLEAAGTFALSVLHLPTAFWQEWAAGQADGTCPPPPPSLRLVVIGGESAPPGSVAAWLRSAAAPIRLINVYGATEVTIISTIADLSAAGRRPPLGRVPVGRPIANVAVYVLDEALQPVPVGVAGQIYVGGVGVARGYLHRVALTAERFVPDPFGRPAGRLYRTGDQGRWRPGGTLEFLGRLDEQVKVRGYRIEPGEVEASLELHPKVAEAVVVARDDAAAGRALVAYLVAEDPQDPPGLRQLRGWVAERLPAYLCPSAFVAVETLPLTANGKLDRAALPSPQAALTAGGAPVGPRNDTERLLAGIWQEVLGVARVGRHDNFFELGGHSLLAARVAARIRRVFAVELPLEALFRAQTVAGLSEVVEALGQASGERRPSVRPLARDGLLPASFGQQRLWFLDQLTPGSAEFNVPLPLRLGGHLDVAALTRALNEVVRRHSVLRTRFASVDGQPVQVVESTLELAVPLVDLGGLPDAERPAEVRRWVVNESHRPFELAKGPLLRAVLLRLADREHVLVLTAHHIVFDGWSAGVLLRELAALYPAFSQGAPSPLPELAIQYADFAVWQRHLLRGPLLEEQLAYWRAKLAGLQGPLELPTDHPRPPVRSAEGARRPFRFPARLTRALEALGQAEGATLFMALLAAFQALLGRYTGQDDVVVGTFVANRGQAELEGLIGFFVNTLALRTNLGGDPTFREVIRRARTTALEAYAHQDVPFERLVEELQPERRSGQNPLLQIVLTLQNTPPEPERLGQLTVAPLPADTGTATFDLSVNLWETPEGLAGAVEYATELFEPATIERLIGHLGVLLEAAVAQPDRPMSRLPLLTEPEGHQLAQWNETRVPLADDSLVELFDRQAARSPRQVAVACDGEELTYQELRWRADRLGGYLRSLGVGPERVVGLCLDRSPDLVVGLLGILKAGGAYLPLDPSLPDDRIALMVGDADARVIVTRHPGRAFPAGRRVVCLDGDWPRIAACDAADPGVVARHDNLACVIYTSGSTGRPKAVAVAHGQVCNRLAWMWREYPFQADEVACLKTAIGFVDSLWELLGSLLQGVPTVIVPDQDVRDPERLVTVLARHRVSRIWLVPSLLRVLLDAVPDLEARLARLRFWVSSGEPLTWRLLARFRERMPQSQLYNLYGTSEVWDTTWPSDAGTAVREGEAVPIGGPIDNVQVRVLDPHLNPTPIGVVGELHVAGTGLARGYLGDPVLTSERFAPDPFGPPGTRLYRTGDLARWRPDGQIELLGRRDQQLKIRGFRVEPGELEAALEAHPKVRQAAVTAWERGPDQRELAAYYVPAAGSVSVDELRTHLGERLPSALMPAYLQELAAIPKTSSGKVDRTALPAPCPPEGDEAGITGPRTQVERAVAAIWGELLGLERVGIDSNFFDVGGHSLLAPTLVARLAETLGAQLPVQAVFERPTVRLLSLRVQEASAAAEAAPP